VYQILGYKSNVVRKLKKLQKSYTLNIIETFVLVFLSYKINLPYMSYVFHFYAKRHVLENFGICLIGAAKYQNYNKFEEIPSARGCPKSAPMLLLNELLPK